MTPGQYLKMRREAAGLAIDGTVLDAVELDAIETGYRSPTDIELQALAWSFPLSIGVLTQLAHNMPARVCRGCACSQDDACFEVDGRTCCWVELDYCSACANCQRPLPEGLAA